MRGPNLWIAAIAACGSGLRPVATSQQATAAALRE
jgi:hypothetical protein